MKWTPIKVECSFNIDTIEEADCWADFTKKLKALKEGIPVEAAVEKAALIKQNSNLSKEVARLRQQLFSLKYSIKAGRYRR